MLGKINLNLSNKNKAIQEYKAKYQTTQIMLERANQKYERTRKQISQECRIINQTLSKLKSKSKQFITNCKQALDNSKTQQIVNMKDLSEYLKKQKELLKRVAQQKQSKEQNKIDLHQIASKVQLQRVLTKIKRIQLQEQVKFLQGNVIVKGNFIYNPSNNQFISPTQDKENTQKLANRIQQLQRLIQLSIPCTTNSNIPNKLLNLKSQSSRIQQCEGLITDQHQKLVKFTQFIQERRESIHTFSLNNKLNQPNTQDQQIKGVKYEQLKIQESQLDYFLELDEPKPLVISMQHPFTSIQDKISELRTKIKKIQKLI